MALAHELIAAESGCEAQAPPSARKVTLTKAAGVVIGAAVLVAGGYSLGRHAGISVRGKAFTMLDTSEQHEFKYMSKECVAESLKLSKAQRRNWVLPSRTAWALIYWHEWQLDQGHGLDRKCGEEEMVCKMTGVMGRHTREASTCFPKHKCKMEHIRMEIADFINEDVPAGMRASLQFFQCGDDKPWEAERDEEEEARLFEDGAEKEYCEGNACESGWVHHGTGCGVGESIGCWNSDNAYHCCAKDYCEGNACDSGWVHHGTGCGVGESVECWNSDNAYHCCAKK